MSIRSRATFRLNGDELRPDEINKILGLEPTSSGLKGERFSTRHNGVRRTSFWLLQSPLDASQPLEEHLEWLLDRLEPKTDSIKSLVEKWYGDFFCGLFSEDLQGGATIESGLLRRLAQMGIPLVLDLYPPEGPPKVDEEIPDS